MSVYVVGIDLGTTNCALAYADTLEATPDAPVPIRPFPVPQVVAVNDVADRPVPPSFLYLPAPKEFQPGGTDLPGNSPANRLVGAFAREPPPPPPRRLPHTPHARPPPPRLA